MAKPNIAPKSQAAGFIIFCTLMLVILTAVVMGLFLNHLQIQEESEVAPTRRIQDLVALLKQTEAKRATLEAEIAQLRRKLVDAEKNQGAVGNPNVSLNPELQKIYEMAGLTPITGRGIIITLKDNKNAAAVSDPHSDPNSGKLQADDLLKLINELKAAGAKAISINDQRVVTTTEIVAAGPMISVNQTRLTQPVVVKAIGDPDVLINALKIPGGILEYLDFFNIKVSLVKKDNITVAAYKGPLYPTLKSST